jgi:hypothetical protein
MKKSLCSILFALSLLGTARPVLTKPTTVHGAICLGFGYGAIMGSVPYLAPHCENIPEGLLKSYGIGLGTAILLGSLVGDNSRSFENERCAVMLASLIAAGVTATGGSIFGLIK